MPKEVNGLSDRVLSHWFPTGKRFHVGATMKEAWDERGLAECKCNLA